MVFRALCALLALLSCALWIKVLSLRRAFAQIRTQLAEKLEHPTNTLLTLSCGDRQARKLASALNDQLRTLRRARQRYESGDLALRERIAGLAHDLRTPLTAQLGYLDLLAEQPQTQKAAGYLAVARERGQLLKSLIDDLTAQSVAVSAPPHWAQVDLNAALEQSLAGSYEALKRRGIEPQVTLPQVRVVRRLDPALLARILDNLLANAVRYGGDLKVTLDPCGEILFQNRAEGLDEWTVGRLFDRYYTVDPGRKSTGLGLAIARELTGLMGGQISARYVDNHLIIRLFFPEDQEKPLQ